MFQANKRVLSISINDGVIKLAQLRPSGVVEKVARASLGAAASVDDLAKSLKTLLNGFDRRCGIICVIPVSAATSKNIEIPSSDPNEIKSIVNLQASRHTPYSREEVLMGYVNLGASAVNNTKLLLVIVHRNAIKERLTVLEKCGLVPDKFVYAPEGQGRFYSKSLNLKKDAAPVGVIDFTMNSVNFLIVARGSSVFARSIPFDVKQLLDADGLAKIEEELKKTLDAYLGEDIDQAPTAFIATTDTEAVKSVLGAAGERLGAAIQMSPYLNFIKGNAIKLKLKKDYADDSFLDVIAPGMSLTKTEVNLMPEEIILKRAVERQSREASFSGVAAVLIMLLLGGMLMSKIYFKDVFLNKNLREQYAAQRQEVAQLQAQMSTTRVIKEYLRDRMVSLDTIRELYRVTPNDIYLTGVSMEDDGSVVLSGISKTMSLVFSYVKALDDSAMFENAKTKSTSTRKDGDKDVAVFEVSLKLKKD